MNRLTIFTAMFPYGYEETFFENEFEYLIRSFEKISIIPFFKKYEKINKRKTPNNVEIFNPILPNNKVARLLGSLFCFSYKIHKAYINEFFSKKVYLNRAWFVQWLISLINTKYCYYSSKNLITSIDSGIVYLYWGAYIINILPFIDKRKDVKYICRLHGGDIYLDRNNGYIPIIQLALNKIDYFIPISDSIEKYLVINHNINERKIKVNRLGTKYTTNPQKNTSTKSTKIVSCSNIISLKRIDLIIDILSQIQNQKIEWHHFGDGVLINQIKEKAKLLPSNITAIFHGRVQNQFIYNFYSTNYVDAFINVSLHEGIPVSIMEAMSFGIPAIATNVGATSELVNNDNGLLLDKNFEIEQVIRTLSSIKSSDWTDKRNRAFAHWENMYNADKNYNNLVSFFKSINK